MQGLRASRSALQQVLGTSPCRFAPPSSGFTSLAALESWWLDTTSPAASAAAGLGLQRLSVLIPSLADEQWLAAPKKKVSPHRKGKRSANKFIRFVPVVSQCSKCQRVFQQQAMPSKCEEDECPAFNLRACPDAA